MNGYRHSSILKGCPICQDDPDVKKAAAIKAFKEKIRSINFGKVK